MSLSIQPWYLCPALANRRFDEEAEEQQVQMGNSILREALCRRHNRHERAEWTGELLFAKGTTGESLVSWIHFIIQPPALVSIEWVDD